MSENSPATEPPPPTYVDAAMVDDVFVSLAVRYGTRFSATYEGLSTEVVKADWLQELQGLRFESLVWGLTHLPEHPPNASQFRVLCASRPLPASAQAPLLAAKRTPPPPFVREVQKRLHERKDDAERGDVEWARRFIAQWTAPGAAPNYTQREFLKQATAIVRRADAPAKP